MKISICVLALAPLALAGCGSEPTVTTTTTEVRQEVVQTRGDQVVAREVTVTQAPPVVRIEAQTVAPGANYVWTKGHWRWTGTAYVWVPGGWIVRPRPAAVWVEGHWVKRPSGWVWIAGHWQA
jgi:hypothetical protein